MNKTVPSSTSQALAPHPAVQSGEETSNSSPSPIHPDNQIPSAAAQQDRSHPPTRTCGEWSNVIMSGIVAGVATGIARAYIDLWIIVAGVMFSICVVNPNLKFSWLQKIVAVVIMFVITFHGHLLLDLYGNAAKLK